MNEKNVMHLETKVWYRFLKVIYITVFVLILLIINLFWIEENFKYAFNFLIANGIAIFIFHLIRGAFFYIALGEFYPKK